VTFALPKVPLPLVTVHACVWTPDEFSGWLKTRTKYAVPLGDGMSEKVNGPSASIGRNKPM
jgi:hypothetical protein